MYFTLSCTIVIGVVKDLFVKKSINSAFTALLSPHKQKASSVSVDSRKETVKSTQLTHTPRPNIKEQVTCGRTHHSNNTAASVFEH